MELIESLEGDERKMKRERGGKKGGGLVGRV